MAETPAPIRRLLRHLLAARPPRGEVDPGLAAALDGARATAVVEAWLSDAVGLGASFPATAAAGWFRREAAAEVANLLGRPVAAVAASSPRGALAAAVGLAEAGRRAAAFLAGPDLAAAVDLLSRAADRRLPLVVYLACRTPAGDALGSSHEAVHAAAGSGAFLLFAANVQEVADLALIARRVSEEALLPGVVAMDGAETALAVQELRLPSAALAQGFVGDPGATLHPPTASQEMLYGRHRRRVPRSHDPERPSLAGPVLESDVALLSEVGRRAYLDVHLPALFDAAFDRFAEATGRRHGPVTDHRLKGAQVALVAVGSAVETAEAVVDPLRDAGMAVGVLGLRLLEPFPEARIVELLAGIREVVVLERVSAPLAAEGPLAARIRSALARSRENGRFGAGTHPGLPALPDRRVPRLASVLYGLGGSPLRAADLVALARELPRSWRSPVVLGVSVAGSAESYPKRQALQDALRRGYPEAAGLGLRGGEPVDTRPAGAFTVAVARLPGHGGEGFAAEAARLLHGVLGGHLRGRPALGWERSGPLVLDFLTWSAEPLRDPGEGVPAEVAVWLPAKPAPPAALAEQIAAGAVVLLAAGSGGEEGLPAELLRAISAKQAVLLEAPAEADASPSLQQERMLGSLLAVLRDRGLLTARPRALLDARRGLLGDAGLGEGEVEARVASFQVGLDGVRPRGAGKSGGDSRGREAAAEEAVPVSVRRLGRTDTRFDSLPRFWDQVGVLYRQGESDQLAPDPYLALGVVPPLSAAFRTHVTCREMLPAFDPAACTGCGDCWSVCPHGAVIPGVADAGALLALGMERARGRGAGVDPLRMVTSKLASRIHRELGQGGADGPVGPLLERAFGAVMESMKLPEERMGAVTEAFGAVREEIAELPVARTEPFFDGPEAERKGGGELLAVVIDPDACKGCGLCVSACAPAALSRQPDDRGRRRSARSLLELVAALPSAGAETLERARRHPEVGPLAGALLSGEARRALSGGDGAEAGSGEALAMRQVLGAVAFHLEPERRRALARIDELAEALASAIHQEMAHALPERDLDALARGLEALGRPEADLAELTSRVESAFEAERVDVPRLRRLVEVAREIADLRFRATTGEGGLGRSTFGLILGPGVASWAGAFPHNPFAVPVAVDTTGDLADLARGLAAGRMQETTQEARMLRRARRLLEEPAGGGGTEDRALGWSDLSAEERRACPPLVLLASEEALTGTALAGMLELLAEGVPALVVLLASDPLGLAAPVATGASSAAGWLRSDLGLLALAEPRAWVVQSSIAARDHLESGLAAVVAAGGPALVRVHAPGPARGGFATDRALERAGAALASRVFPLVLRAPDPGASAELPRPDLTGNPEPEAVWIDGATPAHWALGEERFRAAFGTVRKSDPEPLPLARWLELPRSERQTRTPVVEGPEGEILKVSAALAEAAEDRLTAWRLLQRLAAEPAPAVEVVAPGVEDAALEERHRAELAALAGRYEARISGLRSEIQVEIAQRVRAKLMALATRGLSAARDREPPEVPS